MTETTKLTDTEAVPILTVGMQHDLRKNLAIMIEGCNESLEDKENGYTEEQTQSVQLLRDVARLAEGALGALDKLRKPDGTYGAIICVHCREVLASHMDDPEVDAHMLACVKHPMRELEAEVARLRAQIAEGGATARLEAWARVPVEGPGYRRFEFNFSLDADRVVLDSHDGKEYFTVQAVRWGRTVYGAADKSMRVVKVGTRDQRATIDEMIDAALKRWEEVQGE